MNKKEQGKLLRAWRVEVGERRGRYLALEHAAQLITDEAERQGISKASRWLPRTHASLTRWELGNVKQSVEGLSVIAKAYGINPYDLMTTPPPGGGGPTDRRDVEREVDAYRQFLRSRDAKRG